MGRGILRYAQNPSPDLWGIISMFALEMMPGAED